MNGDAIAAALLQLAEHAERLAVIDAREADHFRASCDRLNELATLISGIGGTLQDQAAILAGLERTSEQVTTLAARLAGIIPDEDGGTRLSLRHDNLPSDSLREGHDVAWNAYLPRLAVRTAGGDPGADPHS